jgi:hypothetical protein
MGRYEASFEKLRTAMESQSSLLGKLRRVLEKQSRGIEKQK